jgi:hypothetical protein
MWCVVRVWHGCKVRYDAGSVWNGCGVRGVGVRCAVLAVWARVRLRCGAGAVWYGCGVCAVLHGYTPYQHRGNPCGKNRGFTRTRAEH